MGIAMEKLPKRVKLKDGRIAAISFIGKDDSVRELNSFINALVDEGALILVDSHVSLKDEAAWKKDWISKQERKNGYLLVARVEGKLAGTSEASRERWKGRNNINLGLALAKAYRGIGLGEALLRTNAGLTEVFFKPKPKNIYLSVLETNKPAYNLYRKLGFKEFAVFPGWVLHKGKYMDGIFLKLDQ